MSKTSVAPQHLSLSGHFLKKQSSYNNDKSTNHLDFHKFPSHYHPPTHKMLDTLFPPIKNTQKKCPFWSQVPNHEIQIFVLKFAHNWPSNFFEQKSLGLPMKCSQPWAVWPTWRVGAPGAKELLDDRSLGTGNHPLPPGSKNGIVFHSPTWLFRLVDFGEKSWLNMMVLMTETLGVSMGFIMYHVVLNDSWWMKMKKVLFFGLALWLPEVNKTTRQGGGWANVESITMLKKTLGNWGELGWCYLTSLWFTRISWIPFSLGKKSKNMTCSTKKCRRIVGPNQIAWFFSALFESWLTGKSGRKEVLDPKVLKNN